jgi:hypothetical protein
MELDTYSDRQRHSHHGPVHDAKQEPHGDPQPERDHGALMPEDAG